jgi:hypothetical protein
MDAINTALAYEYVKLGLFNEYTAQIPQMSAGLSAVYILGNSILAKMFMTFFFRLFMIAPGDNNAMCRALPLALLAGLLLVDRLVSFGRELFSSQSSVALVVFHSHAVGILVFVCSSCRFMSLSLPNKQRMSEE